MVVLILRTWALETEKIDLGFKQIYVQIQALSLTGHEDLDKLLNF